MTIKQIISDVHFRLALGFVFLFLGATFPQYQTVCTMIAGYLGCTIIVSTGKAIASGAVK